MNRDLLIPLRDGGNEELRYAARSWCVNLRHDRLIVAGGKPPWLTDCTFLRVNPRPFGPHRNALANLRNALAIPDLTGRVIVANDDMFVLQPTDDIPVLHRGPLADVAARTTKHAHASRARGAHATLDLLHRLGFTDPLCFDLHVPSVADRAGLVDTLDRIDQHPDAPHVWWRTVYGNLADLSGDYSPDVKVTNLVQPLPPGPYASTSDASFEHGQIGADLRARFDEPCHYERSNT